MLRQMAASLECWLWQPHCSCLQQKIWSFKHGINMWYIERGMKMRTVGHCRGMLGEMGEMLGEYMFWDMYNRIQTENWLRSRNTNPLSEPAICATDRASPQDHNPAPAYIFPRPPHQWDPPHLARLLARHHFSALCTYDVFFFFFFARPHVSQHPNVFPLFICQYPPFPCLQHIGRSWHKPCMHVGP